MPATSKSNRKYAMHAASSLLLGLTLLIMMVSAIIYATTLHATQAKPQSKRHYTIKEEVVPTSVKIKGVKNLESPNFPYDLGVEVENVSDHPIYFLRIIVAFPKLRPSIAGVTRVGVNAIFGRNQLVDYRELPTSEDPFVRPGESIILKVDQDRIRDLIKSLPSQGATLNDLNEIRLIFAGINIGNGMEVSWKAERMLKDPWQPASMFKDPRKGTSLVKLFLTDGSNCGGYSGLTYY
jgi:hypothetical protein